MTDEDVLRRILEYTGVGNVTGPYMPSPSSNGVKPLWHYQVSRKSDAIALAKELYPLLGRRRQQQIVEGFKKMGMEFRLDSEPEITESNNNQ